MAKASEVKRKGMLRIMERKIKFLLLLISTAFTLGLMSNTYSRYVASTTGDVELVFAKWQILVNNDDITSGNTSTINITPIIEESQNTTNDKIAPSSKGYFDINIDPQNVGVSFDYSIDLEVLNENMPDLLITKYAILDNDYVEGDEITTVNLENNQINNSLEIDKSVENYTFEPFTIRVFFEWYEGENEQMDDAQDTLVAQQAQENNENLKIQATITFNQKI